MEFSNDAVQVDSAAGRDLQLRTIIRAIHSLPDPVEDDNRGNHNGEWRTYHEWMLDVRASVLEVIEKWPHYAPQMKLRVANAIYHEAIFGQITKSNPENLVKAAVYAKTNPLLLLDEVINTEDDQELDLAMIYGGRQAMLIAFIQLFEWLTQDNERLVPAAPRFAGFGGQIRLPVHWIDSVGPQRALAFGMNNQIKDGSFSLPPHQYFPNVLPITGPSTNQVYTPLSSLSKAKDMEPEVSIPTREKSKNDPRENISLDDFLVTHFIKTSASKDWIMPNGRSKPTLDDLAAKVQFYPKGHPIKYRDCTHKPARMSALINGLKHFKLIGAAGADALVAGVEARYGQVLKKSKRPEYDSNPTYLNFYSLVESLLKEWETNRFI